MSRMRMLISRVLGLFAKARQELDLDREVRAHLEMLPEENMEKGMSPEEAHHSAGRSFGGVEQIKEDYREQRGLPSLESFFQDIRYALRQLRASPGFTAAAILTLALGIGANAAIFSVGNVFMFRPMPVKDAARLTVVTSQYRADGDPGQLSYPDYQDFRKQTDAFTDMTFYDLTLSGIGHKGHADRVIMAYVPSNFFTMLGIRPAAGRLIANGEGDAPATGQVVVLGHGYWQKRFGGDPGIIGTNVTLEGQSVTVIGVVQKEFTGPFNLIELDAYAPVGLYASTGRHGSFYTDRRDTELRVLATLKPGENVKQAETSLNVIAQRLGKDHPETNKGQIVRVIPERLARPEPAVENYMPLVTSIFLIMVGLVLLVACFNVANLLLARAATREKEVAVRAALGASRGRLIRQMLTESILLAVAGAAVGALLGQWATRVLEGLRPLGDFELHLGFAFDWRVFAYVSCAALLAGIAAGLAPALRVSRTSLNETLRESGRGVIGDTRHHWLRNGLVMAQVAGSLIVLVAAGLFTRSLTHAESIDLGYDPHQVLNVSLDPKLQGYDQPRSEAFFRELLRRAKALPGVESASLAFSLPLGIYGDGTPVFPEGQPSKQGDRPQGAGINCVSPEYFTTLRMKILKGRGFSDADTNSSQRVAIINEKMAEKLWPHQEALGQRFRTSGSEGPFKSDSKEQSDPWVTVVGVVRNARLQDLLDKPANFFYVPQTQNYKSTHVLQLRTRVDPESLRVPVDALVREIDPNLPVYDLMTMDQALAGANGYFLFRMGAGFTGALGVLGLLLAVVGVYGVVSYGASQRRHEIGIRLALGAQTGSVLGLVIRQATTLVGAGVGLGVLAALAIDRVLSSLLVGVSSHDPVTLLGASGLMLAVALVACYIPARRAAKVDPMVALKYE